MDEGGLVEGMDEGVLVRGYVWGRLGKMGQGRDYGGEGMDEEGGMEEGVGGE